LAGYVAPTRELSVEKRKRVIELLLRGKFSLECAKDVGCSQLAVSKIWSEYEQNVKKGYIPGIYFLKGQT